MLPLVVIDFEATALTLESYPIEVGIARIEDEDCCPIVSWSSLIAPAPMRGSVPAALKAGACAGEISCTRLLLKDDMWHFSEYAMSWIGEAHP